MLSEPFNPFMFKIQTYMFVITYAFCFFTLIKYIKALGGLRAFIKILFEEVPKEDL